MPTRPHFVGFPLAAAAVVGWMLLGGSGNAQTPAGCSRAAPLSASDIEALLGAGVPEAPILDAVQSCGVTFIPDSAGVARLRTLGAGDALVALLARNKEATS